MSMIFPWKRCIGLALAGVAGACIAWEGTGHDGHQRVSGDASGQGLVTGESNGKRGNRPAVATTRGRSQAYGEAWAALCKRQIPLEEKARLQSRLLLEWAEVDLEGALMAAASTPRVTKYNRYSETFLDVFAPLMAKDPERFWPVLQGGKLGLETGQLRAIWIKELGKSQPLALLGHFSELEVYGKSAAIRACVGVSKTNPEVRDALVRSLAGLPDNPQSRQLWQRGGELLASLPPDALSQRLAAAASVGEERMLLDGLGRSLGQKGVEGEDVSRSLAALPDATAVEVASAVLRTSKTESGFFAAADDLMSRGQWEVLRDRSSNLRGLLAFGEDVDMARQWALKLPDRPEVEEVFRSAVSGWVQSNMDGAQEWIAGLPAGFQQDNALVTYVEAAAGRRDSEAVGWAMEQIRGESQRAAAERIRKAYERPGR
ncbi:MAG: hypothetical protein QM755_24675 [Luteolibacter sp.]